MSLCQHMESGYCALGLYGGRPHRGVCRVACPIPADPREWSVVEGGDLVANAPGPCPPGYKPDPRIPNRLYRAGAPMPAAKPKRPPCRKCRGL